MESKARETTPSMSVAAYFLEKINQTMKVPRLISLQLGARYQCAIVDDK